MAAGFNSVEAAYAVWLVVRVAITASSGTDPSFARFLEPTAELVDASGDAGGPTDARHEPMTTSGLSEADLAAHLRG